MAVAVENAGMYMKVWTFFRYLSSFSFYLPAQEGQSRSHYIQVQINFLFDFYFLYYPISFILFKNNNIWTMEYRNRAKRVSQHMIRGPPIPKDDEMGRENSSGTQNNCFWRFMSWKKLNTVWLNNT